MNLQLLLSMYLEKRTQSEQLQKEIKEIETSILDHPDFIKSEFIDGYEVKKSTRTSKSIKEDAEIPDEYKSKVFNHNAIISKEPTLWNRIQRTLMQDYPEYVTDEVDMDRLLKEKPELFQDKSTTYMQLFKPKA